MRYKQQYEDMLIERNKFKQQCTQVVYHSLWCLYCPPLVITHSLANNNNIIVHSILC